MAALKTIICFYPQSDKLLSKIYVLLAGSMPTLEVAAREYDRSPHPQLYPDRNPLSSIFQPSHLRLNRHHRRIPR